MPLFAITGGIGAGKSTVLDFFQTLGADVLDADQIAHSLYEPGQPAYHAMLSRWGKEILCSDGNINRKAVAAKVFPVATELTWLNSLLHPLVRDVINAFGNRTNNLVYCAVPLLHESGWRQDFTAVIAVWCAPETQWQRLQARNWSEPEIKQRLSQQFSMDNKLDCSDYGLISDCSLAMLYQQCTLLHAQLRERYGHQGATSSFEQADPDANAESHP